LAYAVPVIGTPGRSPSARRSPNHYPSRPCALLTRSLLSLSSPLPADPVTRPQVPDRRRRRRAPASTWRRCRTTPPISPR
jgi:hypothetical protein